MNDYIIEQLVHIAKEMDIRIEWSNLFDSYTPSCASTKHNSIVINTNWHNQEELPFQLAHEIAHIINHDDCDLAFYHASFSSKEKIEREANLGAIKLLLPIYKEMGYEENSVKFMQIFHVPNYLFDNVIIIMKKG